MTESAGWCAICCDIKPNGDMTELPCRHSFCTMCISNLCGTLCPAPMCVHSRSTDVVIDETAESAGGQNISFGGKQPSMLDLEERQKCDGRRGVFQCVNAARMTLLDCRHRVCFDCFVDKINQGVLTREVPSCPLPRCSNLITRAEVVRLSAKCQALGASASNMKFLESCRQVMDLMPATPTDDIEGEKAGKDEIVVECSMYGREATTKRISVPKMCMIVDMVAAMMQLLRVPKTRGLSTLGIFLRRNIENDHAQSIMAAPMKSVMAPVSMMASSTNIGLFSKKNKPRVEGAKVKYEAINLKHIGKKAAKDLNLNAKTHVVFDVENLLRNQ